VSACDGKGETECEARKRQGGYIRVAIVVDGGGQRDGGVVIVESDPRNSGARGKKRDDGLERGAVWCRSGGRATRDDDGVNTPVISLKCTWVQPRAEALTIVRYARENERERERERERDSLPYQKGMLANKSIISFQQLGMFQFYEVT